MAKSLLAWTILRKRTRKFFAWAMGLWLLADSTGHLPLRNAAVDKLIRFSEKARLDPPWAQVSRVWCETLPNAALRRLFLDFYTQRRDDREDTRWTKPAQRTIKLPEADIETFEIYVQYIYTNMVVVIEEPLEESSEEENAEKVRLPIMILVRFWVLADQLCDLPFGNAAIDKAIALMMKHKTFLIGTTQKIRTHPTESATYRLLPIDCYAAFAQPKHLKSRIDEFSREFLQDLLLEVLAKNWSPLEEVPSPSYDRRCDYHEHNDRYPKCTPD